MEIARRTWTKYINALQKTSDKASKEARRYLDTHDITTETGLKAFTDYAFGLATKYGEGASSMACEFYDALAKTSGAKFAPALPAATATYGETAKTINGVRLKSQNTEVLSSSIGRLVKMAGVDTTMQNAIRDGAQWAWIPNGDTCAFCLMLASRGWQNASKKALKNGHAEHIHPNCDCTFAVRFNNKTTVEGYDPDFYRRMYDNAEGNNSRQKINYLRRQFYAQNKADGMTALNSSVAEEFNPTPRFTPANDIKEAENFASQFIQGGNYSSVSYAGVDLEYANEFNRAMNDVLTQYDPKYKLRNIEPMNMRSKKFKGTTADAAYQWSANDLFYNKAYFKTQKDFAKHLKQYNELLDQVLPNVDTLIEKYEAQSGFIARKQAEYLKALKASGRTNVSMADPYNTMVHELGHYLDDTVFRSEMKQTGFDISASREKYAEKISAYAAQDSQEYVAESFLAYTIGERSILDPELVKIFERTRK